MLLQDLDLNIASKLITQNVEQVTCIECCKYYTVPSTALCGHTLCLNCWTGRRTCPICSTPIHRRAYHVNQPTAILTDHIHALADVFEKLFNIKLEEFALDLPEKVVEADPTKIVKDWLADSQNKFSAPITNSQHSQIIVENVELSRSKIQVHTKVDRPKSLLKTNSVGKKANVQIQDDWDKIEVLPDADNENNMKRKNVGGPMDIEPFFFEDVENEYNNDHPRRSVRNREVKAGPPQNITAEKQSSKNSGSEIDKKSSKTKQQWGNVKKMRKEFSKLNKKNKSKLNVSIEMCKKAQSATNKPNPVTAPTDSEPNIYVIDDNTPDIYNLQENMNKDSLTSPINDRGVPSHSGTTLKTIKTNNTINLNKDLSDSKNSKCKSIRETNKSSSQNKENSDISNTEELQKEGKSLIKTNCVEIDKPNEEHIENDQSVQCSQLAMGSKDVCHKSSQQKTDENCIEVTQKQINSNSTTSTDDIEISIKIGTTVTNIVIKKKLHDVQLKVNTDQEIQASLGPYGLREKMDAACSPVRVNSASNNIEIKVSNASTSKTTGAFKQPSKKNTESADTATVQFEITESVEKEISEIMEYVENEDANNDKANITSKTVVEKVDEIIIGDDTLKHANEEATVHLVENDEAAEYLNDLDIFDTGSVKEGSVHLLKDAKQTQSEIFMPTIKNKKSQKSDKRNRDGTDELEMPNSKKQKVDMEKIHEESIEGSSHTKNKDVTDSEPMNYEAIMSQVFANIDADINTKTQNSKIKDHAKTQTIVKPQIIKGNTETKVPTRDEQNQKDSENVFSMLEKDSQPEESVKNNLLTCPSSTQNHQDKVGLVSQDNQLKDIEMELTPAVDDDDHSIVEDTPQKKDSFTKLTKQIQQTKSFANDKQSQNTALEQSQLAKSIINISDTEESIQKKSVTILEAAKKVPETPITITKFVDHITHMSTPVARKSLNFENENLEDIEDPEQTLCPTTTQEKEFMDKAFEQTQKSQIQRPLALVKAMSYEKFCVAGSCLTGNEIVQLKGLCNSRGWTYMDKYTKDLTHLVVGVDEENKSQRSVKYMCALAASKWIVSFGWVTQCLNTKDGRVDERAFEALDASGEAGPRRARMAADKLFSGFTFYCMPPFSILDIDTLKYILTAAGGRVVTRPELCRAGSSPALLLAEPEHTQEDKFAFLAIQLHVVPVNYEWVLNSLGSYSLGSLHDLLLCPSVLLPPATSNWPNVLMLHDSQYE